MKTYLIGLAVLLVYVVAPVLPIFLFAALGETGLNEGNSSLAVIPWLFLFTMPTGAVAIVIWTVVRGLIWWRFKR